MNRPSSAGFTIVELLVVTVIIGMLFMLLLPAVQAAREGARRAMCANHLVQLIIAMQNYEDAIRAFPPGSVEAQGPIINVPQGYHHNWVEQLLPYLELETAYQRIDRSVGIYHRNNKRLRTQAASSLFRCPSSSVFGQGLTEYAAVHHDIESPIDSDNQGMFFLNSRIRRRDVLDGSSSTLFLGEKLPLGGDLGWLSGTRATLRNTGTPLNSITRWAKIQGGDRRWDEQWDDSNTSESVGFVPVDTAPAGEASADEVARTQAQLAAGLPIVNGLPTNPTAVGGFESQHPYGANFALGDGSLRFITNTIDTQVYRRLGHRADGQLLSEDF